MGKRALARWIASRSSAADANDVSVYVGARSGGSVLQVSAGQTVVVPSQIGASRASGSAQGRLARMATKRGGLWNGRCGREHTSIRQSTAWPPWGRWAKSISVARLGAATESENGDSDESDGSARIMGVSARMSTVVARDYGSLRGGYAAAAALTTAYCMTEIAQQPPLRGCPPMVAADDCMDSLDFCACISWLDHSTGADHRSRAFQLTPSVALSLSLSLRATSRRRGGVMVRAGMNAKSYQF